MKTTDMKGSMFAQSRETAGISFTCGNKSEKIDVRISKMRVGINTCHVARLEILHV